MHRKESEADCDDVPDAPQQRETDPRAAAEVAHLSEKLRQGEDLQAGLLQQVVNLTEDYKILAASATAYPRLRVTDTVPLGGGGGGNRGLGVNIGLGLGGGATLQPGGVADGLLDNGLDAATIQRKLHMHAQYQLQALQVSCICFEF